MTRGQHLPGMRQVAPGAAQVGTAAAGGAQPRTEDRLCSQLPGAVVAMFFCLCRVPRAGTAPKGTELCAATSRLSVVLLGVDTREKVV